jgi:indolepyruvate decarboxylase
VVLVLNNRGYSTEREILEGPFNDIHEWRYERICELITGGQGIRISTHGEFVQALDKALSDKTQPHVLNLLLDPADRSPAMRRLATRLTKRLSTDRP